MGRRGSAGGELSDCVEAPRAAAASALALTVSSLSLLFLDVLRLLQSVLDNTFLSEGGCGDVAGGVRPDSRTGVLLFSEERRKVLGRIRGGGTASPRRSGGNAGGGESCCPRRGRRSPPPGSVVRNEIRR